MRPRTPAAVATLSLLCCLASAAPGADEASGKTATLPDAVYADYKPDFEGALPAKLAAFSLQPTFYNRAWVSRDNRVDALIREGIAREAAGEYAEAIKHYQTVIEKHPDTVVQVSGYGVFLSAPAYVQHRILRFPKKHLVYYRLLYDAPAREVYTRALERYSVEGLREAADFHLATSYGAKALFQLGIRGLDLGRAEEAVRYFEHIRTWFPPDDYDPHEVAFRLALACRMAGREDRFKEIVMGLPPSGRATLERVGPARRTDDDFTPQKRHPRHLSFSDHDLFPPMSSPLSTSTGPGVMSPSNGTGRSRWRVDLPMTPDATTDDQVSGGEALPFHLPWIVGSDVIYKHYNRIFCRSIVTGTLRWTFDLGPLDRMVRRLSVSRWERAYATVWYADQDILVDEDLVFANVQVYGRCESLVAIDRVTGELRWAAGPVRPMDEDDLTTRYDATPALDRQAVYAPWSRDRGEGGDLLYTTVGLTAFDKETGRVLWTREICRLSPTVTTQRKWGVRVTSSTPVVRDGVITHVTNAGVVAALDTLSGSVHWITRYPHVWRKANDIDAHDEVEFGSDGGTSFAQQAGPRYTNMTPLLNGDLVYTAPFDSDHFLALNRTTGQIEWNMVAQGPFEGIAPTGELIFAGRNTAFYGPKMRYDFVDPVTRRVNWSFYPTYRSTWETYRHARGQYLKMSILGHPTLTEDGRMYFSTLATPYTSSNTIEAHRDNPIYAEWCLSVTDRRLIDYRMLYAPKYRDQVEGMLKGKITDEKNFQEHLFDVPPVDVHASDGFDPVRRLPFRHHGQPFELITTGETLRMKFDVDALAATVGEDDSPGSLFTRAEILLGRGEEVAAIDAFERCKAKLRAEEATLIREVDRELFGLYRARAWKARLAGDRERFHRRACQMAETAITVRQDIQSLLALAESFTWQGDVDRAATCLASVIRHYPGAIYAMPGLALGDATAHEKTLAEAVASLAERRPADRRDAFALIERIAGASIPAHFSTVAPIAPDVHLEAETVARARLVTLLETHPAFRERFEKSAEAVLSRAPRPEGPSGSGGSDLHAREREIRAFPRTAASLKVLDDLLAAARKLDGPERQARFWELGDTARTLGLEMPPDLAEASRLKPVANPTRSLSPRRTQRTHPYDDVGETLRLLIERREDKTAHPEWLFIGGRSRKRLGNKFSLTCWDTDAWKPLWEVDNLRLKGVGDEAGFEEVFVFAPRPPGPGQAEGSSGSRGNDAVVTHGKHDVLAFDPATGGLRWRFEVPFDFDLRAINQVEDMLILSGGRNTMAVQASTGRVVWSVRGIGELYHRPFVREGVLVSIRREPYGVTFRRTGSGRLIRHLATGDLNLVTKHPVLAEDISRGAIGAGVSSEALPVACRDDLLMLTDGAHYIAVDLRTMRRRWARAIDNNDVGEAPMRFFIREPWMLVLKRDFSVPALYLIDTRTGEVKWHKKANDVVYSIVFDPDGSGFFGLAPPRTETRSFTLRHFDTESGRETLSWTSKPFEGVPDVAIVSARGKGQVVLRLIHRQDFELLVFDAGEKRVVHRLAVRGVGTYGVHGGKSMLVADDRLMMMNAEGFTASVPEPLGLELGTERREEGQ